MEPTQTDLKDSCDDGNSSLDLDNMDPIRKAKLEEELRTELLKVCATKFRLSMDIMTQLTIYFL